MHGFSPYEPEWIAEEELYVSDTCTEDFFAYFHKKNKGNFYSKHHIFARLIVNRQDD